MAMSILMIQTLSVCLVAVIEFNQTTYTFEEDDGTVEVCTTFTDPSKIAPNVVVELMGSTSPGTANSKWNKLYQQMFNLASFPGLPPLLGVCTNGARRPGESYHVIRGTGVTFVMLYMYGHATVKTDLAVCTSYEDKTSTDREHHLAYKKYPS